MILEIGPRRRVVAGAMDWPGLDRWGTSEERELETLTAWEMEDKDLTHGG